MCNVVGRVCVARIGVNADGRWTQAARRDNGKTLTPVHCAVSCHRFPWRAYTTNACRAAPGNAAPQPLSRCIPPSPTPRISRGTFLCTSARSLCALGTYSRCLAISPSNYALLAYTAQRALLAPLFRKRRLGEGVWRAARRTISGGRNVGIVKPVVSGNGVASLAFCLWSAAWRMPWLAWRHQQLSPLWRQAGACAHMNNAIQREKLDSKAAAMT